MSGNGSGGWVGRSIPRVEDARHLTGRGMFVDDIERPWMLYAAFTRASSGAAGVRSVSVEEALRVPGVEAVLTSSDLKEYRGLRPVLNRPEFTAVEMPLLNGDAVRHSGEPVAMVLADSPHAAEDGAEAVAVEYERREPVVSLDAALAEGAPTVHDEVEGNILLDVRDPEEAEIEEFFGGAHVVVEATFDTGRVTAVPMEGRACLAEWDAREDVVILHTSTQVPFMVRTAVSDVLGLPQQRVRVVAPDVGGGFGQKCVVSREELLVSIAAIEHGRPVKWTEDRQENMMAGFQGHEQRYEVSGAFDERRDHARPQG